MSTFSETITLTNAGDEARVEAGIMQEVRTVTVEACVGTGARFLVVNEKTRSALGLKTSGTDTATLADGSPTDGSPMECPVTEPVEFRWKDRTFCMNALLIPDAEEVLFGVLCMKALDLMADPVNKCLKGCHGDKAIYKLK
jgi:hypothetical protein